MKSLQLRLVKSFLFLLCLCSPYWVYSGQTYYISTQGLNSNSGSINSPWGSLEFAVTVAKAGDTIIIRGGTYTMGEVFIDRAKGRGGARGQYLTIKAFEGEQPIMDYGSRRLIIWSDFVRVEGLHLIMPWRCDAFGEGLQIVGNTFTGPQPKFGAIETGGRDILIEGNKILLTSGGNTRDHGIYVHAGNNITVRNNIIIGPEAYGIHIFDQDAGEVLSNFLIENNFIKGSRTRAGIIVAKQGNVTVNNIILRNNISIDNAWYGLFLKEGTNIKVFNNTFDNSSLQPVSIGNVSNVEIKNNILSGKRSNSTISKIVLNTAASNLDLNNNLYFNIEVPGSDPNPIVADPLFVDPDGDDYSLQSNSPAIDKGIDVGLAFAGSAPDLGAFEFGLITGVENPGVQPEQFSLDQNYPNPFNPETKIAYELTSAAKISIRIYDILGRKVRALVNEEKDTGAYTVSWNGKNDLGHSVASGVYFYKLEALANNAKLFSETKRMILLR